MFNFRYLRDTFFPIYLKQSFWRYFLQTITKIIDLLQKLQVLYTLASIIIDTKSVQKKCWFSNIKYIHCAGYFVLASKTTPIFFATVGSTVRLIAVKITD